MSNQADKKPDAPKVAVPINETLKALNAASGVAEADKKEARDAVSKIHGGNRPWPQLPVELRQAARNDAKRALADVKAGFTEKLVEAGYSKSLAAQLCRDTGNRG